MGGDDDSDYENEERRSRNQAIIQRDEEKGRTLFRRLLEKEQRIVGRELYHAFSPQTTPSSHWCFYVHSVFSHILISILIQSIWFINSEWNEWRGSSLHSNWESEGCMWSVTDGSSITPTRFNGEVGDFRLKWFSRDRQVLSKCESLLTALVQSPSKTWGEMIAYLKQDPSSHLLLYSLLRIL